jgi:hypothetical protein
MSASGGDDRQPPVPVAAPTLVDDTREPLGFNLCVTPLYEQPPARVEQPAPLYVPAPPLPTKEAITGFVLSLVGLMGGAFLPVFTFPVVAAGIILSACRRGEAGGRGFAVAGLILGILGVSVTLLLFLDFATAFTTTTGPS